MTPEDARETLRFHSSSHEKIDDSRWKNGFLGSLRPYTGLNVDNFHEVMGAIRVLATELQRPAIDAGLMSDLWGICYLTKLWGIDEDGMLRRNGLIATDEIVRLNDWINQIGYTVMDLLEGGSIESAFHGYEGRLW